MRLLVISASLMMFLKKSCRTTNGSSCGRFLATGCSLCSFSACCCWALSLSLERSRTPFSDDELLLLLSLLCLRARFLFFFVRRFFFLLSFFSFERRRLCFFDFFTGTLEAEDDEDEDDEEDRDFEEEEDDEGLTDFFELELLKSSENLAETATCGLTASDAFG